MEFPILYKEGRYWKVEIVENCIIRTSWKGENGKRRTVVREIEKGKAGRSLEEQIKLEARSYWNDKRKFMDIYDENPTPQHETVDLTSVRPMLAQDYLKHGHRHKFPCFGQPKLDGFRVIARLNKEDDVIMLTRTGREIKWFDEIKIELKPILKLETRPGFFLDGELFTFDLPFQQMSGLHNIKTMTPEREERMMKMEFHIFDCFYWGDTRPFSIRYEWLLSNINSTNRIRLVDTVHIENKEHMIGIHRDFVKEGYEGTILRDPYDKYVNKRSIGLMKYKDFDDEEFEITGYECGTGMDDGCVIWHCENRFKCRMMGTIDIRQWYYEHGDEFIGKQLTVKFQGRSEDGIPRFPVGKAIRET